MAWKVFCAFCGAPFIAMRSDAKTCPTGGCRVALHRARARGVLVLPPPPPPERVKFRRDTFGDRGALVSSVSE